MLCHIPPSSCRAGRCEGDGGAALGATALEGPSGAHTDLGRRGGSPLGALAVTAGPEEPAPPCPWCWRAGTSCEKAPELLAKRQRSLGDMPVLPVQTGDELPPRGASWRGWHRDAVASGSALPKDAVIQARTAGREGEKSLLWARAFSRISTPSLPQPLRSQRWVRSRGPQRYR